jgi:hypothetical protein
MKTWLMKKSAKLLWISSKIFRENKEHLRVDKDSNYSALNKEKNQIWRLNLIGQ